MLTAAATDEQDTEIDVEVEPRTAAAPSLPLPRPTASTSQSYLPSLRPPGASKDDAEAPGAATGLSRLGSVSMLLAGALVFLFAVARSRIGGEFRRHHLRTCMSHMCTHMHTNMHSNININMHMHMHMHMHMTCACALTHRHRTHARRWLN